MKGYEYDCMIINITNMHFKIFCKLVSLTLCRGEEWAVQNEIQLYLNRENKVLNIWSVSIPKDESQEQER